MSKNIGKNVSQKYRQKIIGHAKRSGTSTLKIASKRVIQKPPEATGDLIGNNIAYAVAKSYDYKITKVNY